jgi:hypothetical protein
MKKVLLVLGIVAMGLQSCEKEVLCNSNCGTIINDGIDDGCYWLEIRNSCTGNNKVFCFDQYTWQSNYVGDNFCVTNETQW